MGEVGMAWRCLLSSRNEQVYACTPREKRRREERVGRGRVRRRKDRERERRREGPAAGTDLAETGRAREERAHTEDLVRETGGPQDSKKEET